MSAPDGSDDESYWAPRRCLREPIPEIGEAAQLLVDAADHHLAGRRANAARAIVAADMPIIRDWIESLWGSQKLNPAKRTYIRLRKVSFLPLELPPNKRMPVRTPSRAVVHEVIARFEWFCAYCGNQLIARNSRHMLQREYAEARWDVGNDDHHNALMCLDNEFDHVIPHLRGGTNDADNLVPCCAPCNCGKEGYALEELGLIDPRRQQPHPGAWDGLMRLAV